MPIIRHFIITLFLLQFNVITSSFLAFFVDLCLIFGKKKILQPIPLTKGTNYRIFVLFFCNCRQVMCQFFFDHSEQIRHQ